jgi:hypothetical protein
LDRVYQNPKESFSHTWRSFENLELKSRPSPCCPPKNSWKNGAGILLQQPTIHCPSRSFPPFTNGRGLLFIFFFLKQALPFSLFLSLLPAWGMEQPMLLFCPRRACCPWVSCWLKGACSSCLGEAAVW